MRVTELETKSIQSRVTEFALEAIELYKTLKWHNELILSKKFLKAATSMGAYLFELEEDMGIKKCTDGCTHALEMARETKYWLHLLDKSQFIEYNYEKFNNGIIEIIHLLESLDTLENKIYYIIQK